jgi:hypothetical protein
VIKIAGQPFANDDSILLEYSGPLDTMPKAVAPDSALAERKAKTEAEANAPSPPRPGENEEGEVNSSSQEAGPKESFEEIGEVPTRGGRESGLRWALEGRNSLDIDLLARVENNRSFRGSSDYLL